ncbi:hypothetical protein BOS5A_90033 [Bosea sp. EC-HK365B]|nr:hypothetical protein BOS5A_90033 [Bosea sp. EC-HK365B]VXC61097.1 hypothetical protein BOSE127_30021 [Bosea sp. 127]
MSARHRSASAGDAREGQTSPSCREGFVLQLSLRAGFMGRPPRGMFTQDGRLVCDQNMRQGSRVARSPIVQPILAGRLVR